MDEGEINSSRHLQLTSEPERAEGDPGGRKTGREGGREGGRGEGREEEEEEEEG